MNLLYLLFIYINESQLTLKAKRSDNYDRRRKEGVGYYSTYKKMFSQFAIEECMKRD